MSDLSPIFREGTSAERLALPNGLIRLGTMWYETDTELFWHRVAPGGVAQWRLVGGSSAFSPVVQTFVGAGPHVVNADTDVVLLDPSGLAALLQLPLSSAYTEGRVLRIVQTGTGTISLSSGSVMFLQSSVYEMSHLGDSIELLPTAAQWTLVAAFGAPRNFEVFVGFGGSDLNVGSAASPLATVAEAVRRASQVRWRESGVITLQANGVYSFGDTLSIPAPFSPAGDPLRIVGERTVVASSSIAAWTPGNATSGTTATFSVPGAPFVASALRGNLLRFTGGALSGQEFCIYENTVNSGTLINFTAGVAAPGDTFDVIGFPTVADAFCSIEGAEGVDLELVDIRHTANALFAYNCQVYVSNYDLRTFAGFFENGASMQTLDPSSGYSILAASIVDVFPVVFSLGLTNLTNCGFRNIGCQVFGRNDAVILQCVTSGFSRFTVFTTGDFARVNALNATLNPGVSYIRSEGGTVVVRNSNINNVTIESALHALDGGAMRLTAVTGAGNFSPCVEASTAGVITVTDPNVGTTIAGGATPVRVGANAPTTWLLIAGGLTADTTDIGAAQSQLCRVGP